MYWLIIEIGVPIRCVEGIRWKAQGYSTFQHWLLGAIWLLCHCQNGKCWGFSLLPGSRESIWFTKMVQIRAQDRLYCVLCNSQLSLVSKYWKYPWATRVVLGRIRGDLISCASRDSKRDECCLPIRWVITRICANQCPCNVSLQSGCVSTISPGGTTIPSRGVNKQRTTSRIATSKWSSVWSKITVTTVRGTGSSPHTGLALASVPIRYVEKNWRRW